MSTQNYSDELFQFYLSCWQKIESYTMGFEITKTQKMSFAPLSIAKGNECFWEFFNKVIPFNIFQTMKLWI